MLLAEFLKTTFGLYCIPRITTEKELFYFAPTNICWVFGLCRTLEFCWGYAGDADLRASRLSSAFIGLSVSQVDRHWAGKEAGPDGKSPQADEVRMGTTQKAAC